MDQQCLQVAQMLCASITDTSISNTSAQVQTYITHDKLSINGLGVVA